MRRGRSERDNVNADCLGLGIGIAEVRRAIMDLDVEFAAEFAAPLSGWPACPPASHAPTMNEATPAMESFSRRSSVRQRARRERLEVRIVIELAALGGLAIRLEHVGRERGCWRAARRT